MPTIYEATASLNFTTSGVKTFLSDAKKLDSTIRNTQKNISSFASKMNSALGKAPDNKTEKVFTNLEKNIRSAQLSMSKFQNTARKTQGSAELITKGQKSVDKYVARLQALAKTTKDGEVNTRALARINDEFKTTVSSLNQDLSKLNQEQKESQRAIKAESSARRRQEQSLERAKTKVKNLTTQMRSLGASRAEIQKVGAAYKQFAMTMRSGALSSTQMTAAQEQFNRKLNSSKTSFRTTKKGVNGLVESFDEFASTMRIVEGPLGGTAARLQTFTAVLKSGRFIMIGSAVAITGLAIGLGKLAAASVRAEVQYNKIIRTLKVATETTKEAEREYQNLLEVSRRLGTDISKSADQFAKFMVAANDTSLTTQEMRDIFESVITASTALGLSAGETSGALRALQQMISKGNVQAEELRGQLGERIPGAFQMAAKAMGVTTGELNKMLERGDVLATELVPKLAKEFMKTFGKEAQNAAEGFNATLGKIQTNFFQLMKAIGLTSTVTEFMSEANLILRVLSDMANGNNLSMQRTTEILDTINQKEKEINNTIDDRNKLLEESNNLRERGVEALQEELNRALKEARGAISGKVVPNDGGRFNIPTFDITTDMFNSVAEARSALAKVQNDLSDSTVDQQQKQEMLNDTFRLYQIYVEQGVPKLEALTRATNFYRDAILAVLETERKLAAQDALGKEEAAAIKTLSDLRNVDVEKLVDFNDKLQDSSELLRRINAGENFDTIKRSIDSANNAVELYQKSLEKIQDEAGVTSDQARVELRERIQSIVDRTTESERERLNIAKRVSGAERDLISTITKLLQLDKERTREAEKLNSIREAALNIQRKTSQQRVEGSVIGAGSKEITAVQQRIAAFNALIKAELLPEDAILDQFGSIKDMVASVSDEYKNSARVIAENAAESKRLANQQSLLSEVFSSQRTETEQLEMRLEELQSVTASTEEGQKLLARAVDEVNRKLHEAATTGFEASINQHRRLIEAIGATRKEQQALQDQIVARDALKEFGLPSDAKLGPLDEMLKKIPEHRRKQAEETAKAAVQEARLAKEQQELSSIFEQTRTPLERYNIRMRELQALMDKYHSKAEIIQRAMANTRRELVDSHPLLSALDDGFDKLGDTIASSMSQSENAAEAFRKTMKSIVDEILQMWVKLSIINPIKEMVFGTDETTLTDVLGGVGGLFGGSRKQQKQKRNPTGAPAPVSGPFPIPAPGQQGQGMCGAMGICNQGKAIDQCISNDIVPAANKMGDAFDKTSSKVDDSMKQSEGALNSFSSFFGSMVDGVLDGLSSIFNGIQQVFSFSGSSGGGGGLLGGLFSGLGGLFGSTTSAGFSQGLFQSNVSAFDAAAGLGVAVAKGKVFTNGQVTPFKNGGIVGGPTVFPMKNGTGLMGEAGPEAVMPLRRTGSGELGVMASGMGGGEPPVIINQTINVETGVSQTVRAEMINLLPRFREEAKGAVAQARRRDPGFFTERGTE